MRNLLTHPKRLPLIAPSILSADFADMGEDCRAILAGPIKPGPESSGGRADLLHLDVMDGHFVPNLTMGPDMCRALRRTLPSAFLDVHLMVTDPWHHAQAFIAAGADHITFHVEAVAPVEVSMLAGKVRELGVTVGLALNPPTAAERIEPFVDRFDLILVMSVYPGRSGQSFIPGVLSKVEMISELLTPNQRLQMDGGIKPSNVDVCLDAGCDVVVAASAIFSESRGDRAAVVRALRGGEPSRSDPVHSRSE